MIHISYATEILLCALSILGGNSSMSHYFICISLKPCFYPGHSNNWTIQITKMSGHQVHLLKSFIIYLNFGFHFFILLFIDTICPSTFILYIIMLTPISKWVLLANLCHFDTSWSHFWKGNLNWENVPTRLALGKAYCAFF